MSSFKKKIIDFLEDNPEVLADILSRECNEGNSDIEKVLGCGRAIGWCAHCPFDDPDDCAKKIKEALEE